MKPILVILLSFIPALLLCVTVTAEVERPMVYVITTGGTIASNVGRPMIDGPSLLRAVPELGNYADIDVEEFSRIGSAKLTPNDWLRLAKKINSLFARDSRISGVVITHGTDTMEETAFFLNLTVTSDKPVVLTGSMRSADEISADGPANLLNAVRVVVSNQAIGQGVMIVFNEDIIGARDASKANNRRVQAMQPTHVGPLGAADPDRIIFFQRPLWPHTIQTEFDISHLDTLPDIAILNDYTGIDPDLVINVGQRDLDGLVIRAFAGGRMSAGMLSGLQSLDTRHMITVISSREPKGRIVGAIDYDFPAVIARDLYASKARILLMLALSKTTDLTELQRIFDTY